MLSLISFAEIVNVHVHVFIHFGLRGCAGSLRVFGEHACVSFSLLFLRIRLPEGRHDSSSGGLWLRAGASGPTLISIPVFSGLRAGRNFPV